MRDVPPLRTLDHAAGNLPLVANSFIGRDSELRAVERLIERHRLVTLLGPGGVGKTRLAVEVGARNADRFEGGVWLVDLWHLEAGSQIEDAITATLGLQHDGHRQPREVLADALAVAPALMILDTCEHLIDTVSDLACSAAWRST